MQIPDTFIYSLGGGCFVYSDIPFSKSPSIFMGSVSSNRNVFTPIKLFNGEIEDLFLNRNNWTSKITECFTDKFLFDVWLINEKAGISYRHFNMMKTNITKRDVMLSDEWLGFFKKYSYSQFFVLDFSRSGYQFFENKQLMEFEECILDNHYNLNNFIYLDLDTAEIKDRFLNLRIRHSIQKYNDPNGFNKSVRPEFSNAMCFYKKNREFLLNNVNRLRKDSQLNAEFQ